MEARNCRKCGKLFNHLGGIPICPACKEAMEVKFQEVKDFVRDHKEATMGEICENCGVDKNQINQWIREERLVFSDDSPVTFNCENCGETIRTGRFCEKCKAQMAGGFQSSIRSAMPKQSAPVKKGSDSPKMRFLDH